ncbi:hypothetical protein [Anaeromicropila populeti]|uniref:Uncharacterized protein n=1 Tax=Anaeromicropila populeti TaxID=37658 RepID=A0A1I6IBB0_9FIRM|nr:hypothetical protein [Anaeromicropila populeti]SFR63914.1 hypothetical protein SAMN05661086_00642 [Anaeromicropila populeti]
MTSHNAIYQGKLYDADVERDKRIVRLRTKQYQIGFYKVQKDLYVTEVEYDEVEGYYGVAYDAVIAGVEVQLNRVLDNFKIIDVNTTNPKLKTLYQSYDVRDRFYYDYLIPITEVELFVQRVYRYLPPDYQSYETEKCNLTTKEFVDSWKKEILERV